jgi:glycine cleavage system aminomethyltransferase T
MARAQAVDGVAAGRGALTSLRIEQGFRAWGSDMSREDSPVEAGLSFAVAKAGDHVGLAAALKRASTRQLRTLRLLDVGTIPTAGQPVQRDGTTVGYVTSAEYGWSVGHGIAYAWLPMEATLDDEFTVLCQGTQVRGVVTTDAVFDPSGLRVRS